MGTTAWHTARMGATGGVLICYLFTVHLFGAEKSAPELPTTRHWKNSQPLTLQELRGKHVLLDFWGYWCVPCVRHMPNLMALHDAFSDRGLTVIGVHDASVQSVAELNERLARTRTNRWMGRDINFPIVLDTPDGSATDPGARGTGATIRAYGITAFPTALLIDPRGLLVGEFHAPDLEGEMAMLERLLGVKAKVPGWRAPFDKVYHLEPDEALRLIPEPFIPERDEFFFYKYTRDGWFKGTQAGMLEIPPRALLRWDKRGRITSHSSFSTLLDLLVGLGFDEREIQDKSGLLKQRLRGDWLNRSGAPREMLFTELEKILPVRFVPITLERQAYRASGTFKHKPLPGDYSKAHIHLFVNAPDTSKDISGGGGSGDLTDFLSYVGRLGKVLVTNTVAQTNTLQWRQHSSAKSGRFANDPAVFEQLLKRVSEQTGLHFEKIRSPERVWNIEQRPTN